MNQKNEKKLRRERKKAVKKFIEENKDMVLYEVIDTIKNSKFKERFLFCISILFRVKT